MGKKTTMQDIADKLNITKVSVSKALNNQPGISITLRQQISDMAKQMGYSKVKSINELSKDGYNFAFICPKRFFLKDETFYTTIYYYINKQCVSQGYGLTCFIINNREEEDLEIPEKLLNEKFNGIFIAGEFIADYLKKLDELNFAKIAIDFYNEELRMDSIVVDNFYTSFEVTNFLIKNGHKEIGFVGNIFDTSSICDRYFGYVKALTLNHLPVRDDWNLVNNDFSGTYTSDFDLPDDLPSAFMCHCDKSAFMLIQKLESCGIKVPSDVSVVSFDNTSICELITPKLTSVNIDKKEFGLKSVDQMINRLNNSDEPFKKIYLKSNLIIRDSVVKFHECSKEVALCKEN